LTAFHVYLYHFKIMHGHLPEFIDPLQLVDKERRLKGTIPLSRLPSLSDVLLSQGGGVAIDLAFGKRDGIAAVTGRVEAILELECQCCLNSLPWPVKSHVRLGIVHSIDEAKRLPEDYEPWLLGETDLIPLVDIIQEELLLAIPVIPQHSGCAFPTVKEFHTTGRQDGVFTDLAKLKKQGKD
jgi:uncharacterized protein